MTPAIINKVLCTDPSSNRGAGLKVLL